MSLVITKDCFPPADQCHNCLRKHSQEVRKKPAVVKDYKRCSNCHLFTYCDRDCQREHWNKVHKHHCKFLSGKAQVKNSEHNVATCARCIEEREASPSQLRGGNSSKTTCDIEENTIAIKKMLGQGFGFHEEGKEGHCTLEFSCELPFALGEVSGQYVEKDRTGLDALLAHSLKILQAMFIKTQEEEHKKALHQLWSNIIGVRSLLWYNILVSGIPKFQSKDHLSDKVDSLKPIYGASNPWWKSLKFTVDCVVKINRNLISNFIDFQGLEDPRFQKFKQLQDYYQSQLQIEAMVCEKQLWPIFMLWPRFVNGSLAVHLPPSTRCHSCYAELSGEVEVTAHEINSKSLPRLFSDFGDHEALMACCPLTKNPNCIKDCLFKNVEIQMKSDEDQWKEFLTEYELFIIESRVCDFCMKMSLSSHRCSACLTVQYCSTVCQKKDLGFHKSVCATWAKDKSRRIKGKDGQMDHWKSRVNKQ